MDRARKVLYLWRMKKTALTDCLPFHALKLNTPPRFYRCEPDWSWRPPTLTDFDLWYVQDGQGQLTLNGTLHAILPQICFLFPPGSKIHATQDLTRRLLVFAVHFSLLDGKGREIPAKEIQLPPQPREVHEPTFFASLARRCESLHRLGNKNAESACTLLVAQMLHHLCMEVPAISEADSRINQVIEAIQEEPGYRWSVVELARRAGLSRSQLTRRFVSLMKMPPERFLIQARIERARQLLRETDMSIGQIASGLGYRDIYYFSRQFRQITGRTASSLRQTP